MSIMASPPAYEISFSVEAKLGHGEVIYVCGSCPTLGAKDPSRALRLSTDPSSYPVWSSEPVAVPLRNKVTYRYCVVAGGKLKRWEEMANDRELGPVTELSAAPAMVEDVLNKYKGTGSNDFRSTLFSGGLTVPQGGILNRAIKFTAANRTSLQASNRALRAKTVAKEKSSAITKRDGVVVVSFFLPVIVCKNWQGRWQAEWDYESLLSLRSNYMNMRVTRLGFLRYADEIMPEDEEEIVEALAFLSCVPVFLDKALANKFYREFCKGVLWPVFHHVVDVYGDLVMRFFTQDTLADLWQCYANVNRKFRDKIVEVYNEGDMVWVHGFHLLLLPSFLTRVLRTARVGLFLHTPFPSSEIFRTLPFREDLLRGMLNADQIGFHLYEYARHFLTCCKRILGLNEGDSNNRANTNVFYNGRCVSIESMHGGIEPSIISSRLKIPNIALRIKELRKEFEGRFVFVGIDKVERLKGLQLKFTAFYKMLLEYPDLADKVVLLQLGISVFEREQDYHKCLTELKSLARKVNREFAPDPDRPVLVLQLEDEQTFTVQRRIPYLSLADCLINTSVRDGLNGLPLEYVFVQHSTRREDPGVMLLSEFTSCMRVLRGCIRINPWKVAEVAKIMAEVVTVMDLQRRKECLAQGLEYVVSHTTSFWAAQILTDLKAVGRSSNRSIMSPVGLGLNFRVIGMESNFSMLDVSSVMRGYRIAKRRVIILDYGGTICATAKRSIAIYAHAKKLSNAVRPPESLRELLTTLCADPRNLVFVVSGREKAEIEDALGDIKNLGLATEHGLHFRYPGELPSSNPPSNSSRGQSVKKRKWETLVALRDQSWKQLTKTIMNLYAQRTHGTYVVNKGSALLWQFRDADPEFGWRQSKELEDHLTTVLKPFSVEILRSNGNADGDGDGGYIEVRPGGVNKGAFVSFILSRQVESGLTPELILAVGNEESDEMMFEAVKDFSRGVKGEAPGTPDATGPSVQHVPSSPGRRRGSYQVGATAAVLIASAAAELKRQQEEEAAKQLADERRHHYHSLPAGSMACSAPADVHAAAITLDENPVKGFGKGGISGGCGGGGGRGREEKSSSSGALAAIVATSSVASLQGHGGSDGMADGIRRRSQSEVAERLSLRPPPISAASRAGGTESWRDSVIGGGGGNGAGGVAGAPPLGVQCFTCTVGKKPSQADAFVNDIDEVLELLRGLVKVSSSVARNYSTSHLSDMRLGGLGGGGSANYENLSLLSAQFQAAESGWLDGDGEPLTGQNVAVGGMAGMMKSLSVVVMPSHFLPSRPQPTAPGTMTAYFHNIEEGDEEDEGGIFF